MNKLYKKKECIECDGTGKVSFKQNKFQDDGGHYEWVTVTEECTECDGHGFVLVEFKNKKRTKQI
jgi:hypothetical protein